MGGEGFATSRLSVICEEGVFSAGEELEEWICFSVRFISAYLDSLLRAGRRRRLETKGEEDRGRERGGDEKMCVGGLELRERP